MDFCVDEFSRTKLQENQKIINTLMNRVRELQCEMNCMHDSKDCKDAESMHSGPFSYIPSESALFLFSKMIEEDCWAAPKCAVLYLAYAVCIGKCVCKSMCMFLNILEKKYYTMGTDPDAG